MIRKVLTDSEIMQVLVGPLGMSDVSTVALIGSGAWSSAFGFVDDDRDLVIRIGKHVSDFRRDEAISTMTSPALPIPEVLDIGQVPNSESDGLHYCISTRAFGEPLESSRVDGWPALAEQLADALEAMRCWSPSLAAAAVGTASVAPWHDQLLEIERDDLDPRGAGWPAKLATSSNGSEAFTAGLVRLQALEIGTVPLTLVHGDLINRNVHVDAGRITGIFDWGCQRWGDHLCDLAWFHFWSPWHPTLNVEVLERALRDRWQATGYMAEHESVRTRACLTFIGLEHLIYNATIDSWGDLEEVVDRMAALDLL